MDSTIRLTAAVVSLTDRLVTTLSFLSSKSKHPNDKILLLIGALKTLNSTVTEVADIFTSWSDPTDCFHERGHDISIHLEEIKQILSSIETILNSLSSKSWVKWSSTNGAARIPRNIIRGPVKICERILNPYNTMLLTFLSSLQ